MKTEPDRVREKFALLIKQPRFTFPAARQRLMAPTLGGVYVIYDSRGRAIHVGRTSRGKNGLHQRLRNHLGAQSSFVNKFFAGDGAALRGRCSYQCLPISNDRLRCLVESYAVGVLCPAHLGLGKILAQD